MTAYLCVGFHRHIQTINCVRIFSETASSVTRTGNGIEWAELYSYPGESFAESRRVVAKTAVDYFKYLANIPGWDAIVLAATGDES